jgi:hypothetical protein
MIILRNILWVLLTIILVRVPAYAQTPDSSPRVELGMTLGVIMPVQDFGRNLGNWSSKGSGALAFDLIPRLNKSGLLRLRIDYSFGDYHRDSVSKRFYTLRSISFGPEVGLSHGPVQPYISAEYGRLSFIAGGWLTGKQSQQINKSIHGTGEWIVSGGGRIPVGPRGRWAIDIGLRYHHGGTASYLGDGGVQTNPDDSLVVIPTRSQTHFMMYMVGFQFRP